MASTKKEHYVPRCYLKNFVCQKEDRINVFDKEKMQVRKDQMIMDVAMENHFYDLKLSELYKNAKPDEQEKIKQDFAQTLNITEKEIISLLNKIDDKQYIEKDVFANLEGEYCQLLSNIIKKSYGGNQWVIDTCNAMSESEKKMLSVFIALQIIRTKSFRETLRDTVEKGLQTLAYKSQINDIEALPKELFEVSVDKDSVKLQHSSMILDPEVTIEFAEAISQHIWVVYVNKTHTPFYTSDDPVVNIPHKFDKYLSYGGINSEGIEIVFPLSSTLLLGMYDSRSYKKYKSDRRLIMPV